MEVGSGSHYSSRYPRRRDQEILSNELVHVPGMVCHGQVSYPRRLSRIDPLVTYLTCTHWDPFDLDPVALAFPAVVAIAAAL